jgi:hypothetical protein
MRLNAKKITFCQGRGLHLEWHFMAIINIEGRHEKM